MRTIRSLALATGLALCCLATLATQAEGKRPRNIIFILTDDQRFDALGVMNPALKTPNLDRLAKQGAHFRNAFVTTSLCSPSRATILTGQYMHDNGVVDNNRPLRPGTVTFPSYLQRAGYQTAFFGKWHMGGDGDEPQPGFDHWVSFAGQGNYFPDEVVGESSANGQPNQLNIDGKRVPQKGYITDELTDYALDWLRQGRDRDKPFFMYVSHKGLHANFRPAPRHADAYKDLRIDPPASMADTPDNYVGKPLWVRNQRNSWHGVDFPYHSQIDIAEYRRNYYRTLLSVDESIGKLMAELKREGLDQDTAIIFMGDNGFMFGEHGLIDKRNAYEESMRVPLLAYAPGLIKPGTQVEAMVANLDIAPTMLDIAGVPEKPASFAGSSFLPLARGEKPTGWRQELLYEYYWEFNYPHTPTTFAVRTDRYKLIQYHGVWDTEELYDLQADPQEMRNLIGDPALLETKVALRARLFDLLANGEGNHVIPFTRKFNSGAVFRNQEGSPAATFPSTWMRRKGDWDVDQHFLPDGPGKDEKLRSVKKY